MLSVDAFADVVGFFHFYDLDALLLTDARCSALAHSAASRIRTFDFSDYTFVFCTAEVHVYNLTDDDVEHSETALKFRDATDLDDFIPTALRNCTLGRLAPFYEVPSDAMRQAAHTVVVKGTLYLSAKAFATAHALVGFVTNFRSVQSVKVHPAYYLSDSLTEELVALFDRHGFTQAETCPSLLFVNRSA